MPKAKRSVCVGGGGGVAGAGALRGRNRKCSKIDLNGGGINMMICGAF